MHTKRKRSTRTRVAFGSPGALQVHMLAHDHSLGAHCAPVRALCLAGPPGALQVYSGGRQDAADQGGGARDARIQRVPARKGQGPADGDEAA